MSLRRAIKALGFRDFVKMGFAVATAKKITVPPSPKNESQRRNKVNEVAIIGRDFSQQFEIFPEMVKMVVGVDIAMINILDGKNQFIVGLVELFSQKMSLTCTFVTRAANSDLK